MQHDINIELIDLDIGYDDKIVVKGINFTAKTGQMICLLGPNGAGKTTLLRTISGHLPPISGSVLLNGKHINKINRRDLARDLSVVFTEQTEPGMFTAYEMVSLGRHPYTGFFGKLTNTDKGIVKESMEMVNCYDLRHRYFSTLSDGEKQKVMIARALCQRPMVMILDEPTSHLDVKNKVDVLTILRKMSRDTGITSIISLHDVDLALKTCDVVILVGENRIIDWGSPEDVINADTITSLYNIKNAGYNHKMGSLELKNYNKPKAVVLSGRDSGINIYRMLSRLDIGFLSVIPDENDVDYHIVNTMGNTPVIMKSSTVDTAADVVYEGIDNCGITIISHNEDGLYDDFINHTIKSGKRVVSLKDMHFDGVEKITASELEGVLRNLV